MGVLVTLAVIAILAGVLGPLAYRQLMQRRVDATLEELAALETALMQFHADTGRLPGEAEGLAALINNPGAAGWQGPYLVADRYAPLLEITTDAFGQPYVFDRNPDTTPPGACDLILVSAGPDGTLSSGTLGAVWDLGQDSDDLHRLVNAAAGNQVKVDEAGLEMQAIRKAAQNYFNDHAEFPASLDDLTPGYLSPGIGSTALTDPWLRPYTLIVDNAGAPPTLSVCSTGPDRQDDGGGNDDIILDVSSVVPGRHATYHMIRIAQTALDARPGLALSGDWDTDRQNLQLASAFGTDGWGQAYGVATSQRLLVSAGPDGDLTTAGDNIPPGVVPDAGAPPGAGAWDSTGFYSAGDTVTYGGHTWVCLITHQCYGDPNWAPGVAPSLWALVE